MNRSAFPIGLPGSVLVLVFSLATWAAEPPANPAASAAVVDQDKETDKQQMLQIWKAIMEYKKAHGQVPDYLSDLVPQYLPDKAVLVSPLEPKKRVSERDPKSPTSYSYEFRATEFAGGGRTFRDVKEEQMKEFGPVVPILRCALHGARRMNVTYSGDYFESPLIWESSPEAQELIQKLGVGPGFDTGDFTELRVVDDQSGAAIAGAEVRLTQRQYHFLPLPDRTLKTDAEGKVRVPLGSPQPPSRQLTVTVFKPGYFAPSESWQEETLPAQKTWRMAAGTTIGGVVKDHDGQPLEGARVAVLAAPGTVILDLPPGFNGVVEPPPSPPLVPVDTCVTDAQGRWHSDSVPKDFVKLLLAVNHPQAWEARYRSGAQEPAPTVDREALLGQTAELRLEPPVAVQGVALAPDGAPLANEEVTVAPAWRFSVTKEEYNQWVYLHHALQHAPPQNVKTDATGHFSVPWRYPSDLMLSLSPKNLAVVARTVTVAPGMEPIQLKASARRRITGQVRDGDGKPIPKVRVTFIGWAEATVEQQVATTDSKGEFTWDAAPSDQIGLTFTGNGFAPSTEWVPADKKDTVQVELRR